MRSPAGALSFETVARAFEATAARVPEQAWLEVLPETAQAYGIEAGATTYEAALQRIEALRLAYRSAGCGHGHRAGLMLQNRPEFLLHWIALNGLGASIVPLSHDWRAAELEYVIAHAGLDLAVCAAERREPLRAAARAAAREVTLVDARAAAVPPAARPAPSPGAAPGLQTECALLYTSGTTGRPKGCVLSNEYFLWAGAWYASIGGLCDIRPGAERMLTPLPLTHMNALAYSAMCMMLSGGCLVLLDRFHPRGWWTSVRAARATIVHYLGVMPAMLLAAPPAASDRDHAVRFGFGAGVGARHHAEFERRFGFPLVEAWAMTETGAGAVVIANREPRHVGVACFGRPEPDLEVRLVDEGGAEAAAGEPGELLVRRRMPRPDFGFFSGYLRDPEATAEAWAGDWFHTGDIVARDAAGCLHFVDRKKNVIRRSGENISAVEVEGVLAQHPGVGAIGVCAVPDEVRGDEVFALVVPSAAAGDADAALADRIAEFCAQRLAYYKAPGYVAFCDRLPLTATEKLQRGELRRLAEAALQQRRCFDLRTRKRRDA